MKFIKLYVISWWCKTKTVAAGGEGNGLFSYFSAERNVTALKMSQRKAFGNHLSVIHTLTSRLNIMATAWPQNHKALNSTTRITHLSALWLDLHHQEKIKKQKRFTLMWSNFLELRLLCWKNPENIYFFIFLRFQFMGCSEGEQCPRGTHPPAQRWSPRDVA